jgi:hypothetical protein
MLPGFRFLFVAIVLSMSTLIFGLGAAALLRSAHEEFVSLPSRRAPPEVVFAQRVETTTPTLALLRVDAPPVAPAGIAPATAPEAAPDQPAAAAMAAEPSSETSESDKAAAPGPAVSSEQKSEPADKPVEALVSADPPPRVEIAAPPAETEKPEAQAPQTRIASVQEPAPAAEPSAPPAPAVPPLDDGARAASLKIATLGGPAVTINPQLAAKSANAGKSAASAKRAQAKPRVKRRRIVRPRIAPPAPATLGFFDPAPTTGQRSRLN